MYYNAPFAYQLVQIYNYSDEIDFYQLILSLLQCSQMQVKARLLIGYLIIEICFVCLASETPISVAVVKVIQSIPGLDCGIKIMETDLHWTPHIASIIRCQY